MFGLLKQPRRNVVKRYQCGLPRLLARFPAQKAGGNPTMACQWLIQPGPVETLVDSTINLGGPQSTTKQPRSMGSHFNSLSLNMQA